DRAAGSRRTVAPMSWARKKTNIEDREAEDDVVDPGEAGAGEVDERRGLERRPHGVDGPRGGGDGGVGEPLERAKNCGGTAAGGVADGAQDRQVAHAHVT